MYTDQKLKSGSKIPLTPREDRERMSFFNGLYSYEIVMLVLGTVLFLVIIGALLTLLIKNKPFASLLPLFAIAVVMIGYPSIQSISYSKGVLTITNMTSQLQQDPTNASLRQTLQQEVAKTASRPATDPGTTANIAAAQFALGDRKAAEANLALASRAAPQLPAVAALQKKIDLDTRLTTLTAQVEQNPQDQTAKAQLQQSIAEGSALKTANPALIAHLASAQMAVGNSNQARALADKALQIQPSLPEANAVMQRVAPGK